MRKSGNTHDLTRNGFLHLQTFCFIAFLNIGIRYKYNIALNITKTFYCSEIFGHVYFERLAASPRQSNYSVMFT